MTVKARSAANRVAVVALMLVVTGCGGPSVPGRPESTSTSAGASIVNSVDACKVLSSEELRQFGQPAQGTAVDEVGEVGCDYPGQDFQLQLAKSSDGLDYFTKNADKYVKLTQNSVNARSALQILISNTGRECSQVMALSTGYFVVGISYNFGHTGDPCAKALEIAQVIEPRLPK